MNVCVTNPDGSASRCTEVLQELATKAPAHQNHEQGLVVFFIILGSLVLLYVWWQYVGRHERNILTGASRHFERERELENERVMKRIIERRITRVTDKEPGGIFIAQVINGNAKPRYFKFTQEMLAETIENIYYYLTESRTSIHEHNFSIETKRVYS